MSRMGKKIQGANNVNIKKLWFIGIVATILMTLLIGRLYYIQIIKHDLYSTEVNKQRQMHIPLNTGRGLLLDRNLIPLTDRTERTTAVVFPQMFTINEENIMYLSSLTGITVNDLTNRIKSASSLIELPLIDSKLDIEHPANKVRGLFIISKKLRYDVQPRLSHIIGYINQADNRGLFGLEKSMDQILHSKDSRTLAAVVDGRKRLLPGEGYTLVSQEGEQRHIRLTIDYQLQRIAEEIMDKEKNDGAVVISKVDTGELLSIVSRPNFNPNDISEHLNSYGDELYNKALQLTFPPGSIFKIIVAAAALEKGLVDLGDTFYCSGAEQIGSVQIKCISYDQGGHGSITFEKAFAESCNSTFIQLGQRIGAENIINMAKKLGLGQKVGIGISEEEAGNLPSGNQLLGPAIGNISIGQGVIEVTPLQINQIAQMIANDGIKRPLFIVDAVVNDDYEVLEKFYPGYEEVQLQGEALEKLQLIMSKVMSEGTGREIGALAAETAGKTGTAQASLRGQPLLHAWFTGYYPLDQPKYAITVFVQNGGSGGRVAVPIFKEIVEELRALGY